MKLQDLRIRIDELINFSEKVLASTFTSDHIQFVENDLFQEFRSASLSFLKNTFGNNHTFFREFDDLTNMPRAYPTKDGIGVLKAAKQELDGGWIFTKKAIISAEIFSDFLDMAQHLLSEGYKDAAAVMAGSVLEEHLRHLCEIHKIDISIVKYHKIIYKKAELLNSELRNVEAYNLLDQKSITSWLDLRNNAAHGKYSAYTKDQVVLFMQGITDFISRTSN